MRDEAIAIVGASCRFPGAEDLEGFWRLLLAGEDAVSEIGAERWSTPLYHHPDGNVPGKSYTWSAGLISGVALFEPAFFGISPREAAQMDPQQRLLLELVWHAVEDAGWSVRALAGNATGVYIGASGHDYADLRLGDPAGADAHFMTGNTLSILANRISYVFDLRGPSLTVDTACSSSLVALHHACEAIRAGRVEQAIVGGVNLLLAPYPFIGFSRASMLSRRGRCFAFDERADGYVRAEGGGVVVLKPLAAARAEGDAIRAVIRATGVNSDGRTVGLSLPSETAQADLLRSVYDEAGIAPEALAFFEMHGTGTPVGDPVEAAAVGRALGQRRLQALPIGSVKGNIGHLEPASGMAGLLKATLALERGVLPPSLHCETPNPRIPFAELNLSLVREALPLDAASPAVAGVNSFGFGGTNAHAVVATPPKREAESAELATPPPLLVSAATEASLRRLAQAWRDNLGRIAADAAPALLRAAARGRDHQQHRFVVRGCDSNAIVAGLDNFLEDAAASGAISGTAVRSGKLAFVFSGNGAQFAGMGRSALHANAAFRAGVEEVAAELLPELGWSVAERLAEGADDETIARADFAQPLLFAIQVGIVRALREEGITAFGHYGHSVGEIAAAWAAGALSLADAGRVVIARSRCQQRTRGSGRMAALALGCSGARDFLAELDSSAEVAAINSAHSVTICGDGEEIERCGEEARYRGLWFRRLDLDFAFHSRLMDPIRDELVSLLGDLRSRPPDTLLLSTVTGAPIDGADLDAEYWWRNIRNPVRFAEASARMIAAGCRIFLEIGPNAILQSYLNDALRAAGSDGRVLPSLTRKAEEANPFPAIAARAYVAGYDLSGSPRFAGAANPRGLPLYPWSREPFWFKRTTESSDPINPPFDHPLLGFRREDPAPCWRNHLDEQLLPWIADHAIDGAPVFPAAAIIETALAAARWRRPEAAVLELFDAEIRRPLPFDKGSIRELRTTLAVPEDSWALSSRLRLSDEAFTVHAVGRLGAETDARLLLQWPPVCEGGRLINAEAVYRIAAQSGLDYGTRFRTLRQLEILGDDEVSAFLDCDAVGEPVDPYLLHPALLDGALQSLLGLLAERRGAIAGTGFVPWRFGRVRLLAPFGRIPSRARARLTRVGVRSACADLALFDAAGAPVVELLDCWFRRLELRRRGGPEELALRVDLAPAPLVEAGAADALLNVLRELPQLVQPVERDTRPPEQALLLDALVGAAALQSLRRIVADERSFTLDDLIFAGRLSPLARGLAQSLLQLLARLGAATQDEAGWRFDQESGLPSASDLWRSLLADAPDLAAELTVVAAAIAELPRALAEGPREADGAKPLPAELLLGASPVAAIGLDRVCAALALIAPAWPEGRLLRVLEIGATDVGVTRRLVDRLAASGVPFRYLAAAADPEQAARLAFALEPYAEAAARPWPPSDESAALDGPFDVILAVNACARLQPDLAGLHPLLASGGLLLAVEPEPNALWDVGFGQGQWWRGGRSGEASPLRSGEDWRTELAIAGFAGIGGGLVADSPWPVSLFWGTAAAAAAPQQSASAGRLRLLAAETPLAAALERAAAERRITLMRAATCSADDVEPGEVVLFLADMPAAGDADRAAQQLAALARTASVAAECSASLWVVTCDAHQPAPADADTGPSGAAIWGLARVLVNEVPRLSLRLVDLSGKAPAVEQARQIVAELEAETNECEIAWTPEGRYALRLRAGLPPRRAAAGDAVVVANSLGGSLEALAWERAAPRPPGRGEVEIEVRAAGLNFRDLMWAMGMLPEEALIDGYFGANFGLECAGIVRALGPGVENLTVGDRVMALAPTAIASRVVAIADAVVPIPPDMDFAAAATVPVAFITATYALGYLARVQAGEYVLIHAAAGGVGLAAIQYAKRAGAIVIATAGSDLKRGFLSLAGADYVLDSRDLAFADAVREITDGQGVDVVLNSLSGEAMQRSLEVLRPFGRFLELGKRDFYQNRSIQLRPLRQNASYFAIDVDQLPLRRQELARSLLAEVGTALAEGSIRPLAHRTFAFGALGAAFRLMQSSGHIGKLVLTPAANEGVRLGAVSDFAARRDGAYLVTGGVDGFGFAAARWLAERGAGSIALLSRRGAATPGAAERIAELEALGASARVYAGDVGDPASLTAILGAIRAGALPLRGVVHAAAAIEDGLAAELDPARIAAALHAKLGGALALDRLTREDSLDFFVLFSSATTLAGAPGQGAYVAANAGLEALARRRQAAGRPALAVQWGPIEDAGYLAERPDARAALARRLGARPVRAADALGCLPAMLASGLPVVALADTSWGEARRFLPILGTPFFADISAKAAVSPSGESLSERLAGLEPEAAATLLRTVVAEEAASILRLPANAIDPARPLSEYGMDSLMAVELRLGLEARLRVDLPLVSLAEGTSVASIAARLAGAVAARPQDPTLIALAARHEAADLSAPSSPAETNSEAAE